MLSTIANSGPSSLPGLLHRYHHHDYHPSSSFPLSWLCRLLHHRHVALQPRESTSTTMMSPATALVRSTTGVQANLECRLQPRQLDNDTPMVYRRFLIYFPELRTSVLLCLAIFPSPRGGRWMEIFIARRFLIVDDHRMCHIFYTLLLRNILSILEESLWKLWV